jgi:predicted kinase
LAAYLVAEQIAEKELASGRTVIVDAVNAAESARLQWRDLADRTDVRLRVIEVVCSDAVLHRRRLEKRERNLPHLDETTWRAVEQSLEGYASWSGPSSALPRVTIDSVQPLGVNVDAALAFIAA